MVEVDPIYAELNACEETKKYFKRSCRIEELLGDEIREKNTIDAMESVINAFQKVLKKIELKREDLREIFEESYTVSDKIEYIIRALTSQKSVSFFDLFEEAASRTEIAVTFLALLELIRMRQIRVFQEGLFAEIEIRGVLN